MLRTNLSTRPFYNERAVHALATVVGIIVLAVTIWQVTRVVRLSAYKTELNAAIARDRDEVQRLASEANHLIEQRTFSWTQLFNHLEATLPDDVMLTSVSPDFEDNVTRVHMEIQGRSVGEIDSFWERLEKTKAFHDIEWSGLTVTEEGIHRVQMTAIYTVAPR